MFDVRPLIMVATAAKMNQLEGQININAIEEIDIETVKRLRLEYEHVQENG